jgi:hypothetical protein
LARFLLGHADGGKLAQLPGWSGRQGLLLNSPSSAVTGAFAGPGSHQGNAVAVDGDGNVYVTGGFRGTADFDPGDGDYLLDSTTGTTGEPSLDLFVVKLTPGA